MAGSYEVERSVQEGITQALKDNLADEMIRLRGPNEEFICAPDPSLGYIDDPTIVPVDMAHYVAVWINSTSTSQQSKMMPGSGGTYGVIYEYITAGVMYNFAYEQDQLSRHKLVAGEAIRRCIWGGLWVSSAKSFHSLNMSTEYRWGSRRQKGGSSVGLIGNLEAPGDLLESFTIAVTLEKKVNLLRYGVTQRL